VVVDRPTLRMGTFSLPRGSKAGYPFLPTYASMSAYLDNASRSSPDLVNDELFDFEAASREVSSYNPKDRQSRQATIEDAELSDVSSDNDDGLFCDGTSTPDSYPDDYPDDYSDDYSDDKEAGEEEDAGTTSDQVYSWKIDHSSGDHKLRRKLRVTG